MLACDNSWFGTVTFSVTVHLVSTTEAVQWEFILDVPDVILCVVIQHF